MARGLAPKRTGYAVPGKEQAKVQNNLTHKRIPDTELRAVGYFPRNLERGIRRPAVVLWSTEGRYRRACTSPSEDVYIS